MYVAYSDIVGFHAQFYALIIFYLFSSWIINEHVTLHFWHFIVGAHLCTVCSLQRSFTYVLESPPSPQPRPEGPHPLARHFLIFVLIEVFLKLVYFSIID